MRKPQKIESAQAVELGKLLADLGSKISNLIGDAEECTTGLSGLTLYRSTAPTPPNSCSYEPSLLIIPQGRKRVDLGRMHYAFGQSDFLLTSVDLPVISRVIKASKEEPYLAFFLKLDMSTVRDILNTEDIPMREASSATHGMATGEATVDLLRACCRLMDLLDAPKDISFLGKMVHREIIYRLLQGTQGQRLRAIATLGDQSQRTAKAVAWLRSNYDKPLRVEQLASVASMSPATLHRHFRDLTAMSPLQYQKQLRLQAARHRMLTAKLDASTAAFEVGYESASQFSREYKRHFGKPPMQDVQSLRLSGNEISKPN